MNKITIADFENIDIRLGKIVAAELLPNPRYTTHKLTIDFGDELGKKISGARLINYQPNELVGKLMIGVINLQPRQIGKIMSEVLTLGVADHKGDFVLLSPLSDVPLGGKVC
ncbi:MAG TPA: tRNA-binding protein [Vitreimonas sp.]|nr:tRNA-binding protein [Vitreimonas sp.]